jgi:hypothetical protein
MPQLNDLSKSLVALEQDATLIAVIEMGQSSWLVADIVPGIDRQPLKKLAPDRDGLLQLLYRWRKEASKARRTIKHTRPVAMAFGWRAGCAHKESKPTSSTRRVFRSRASIDGQRRTALIPSYSSAPFSVGCAVSRSTAAWLRFPRSKMRTPGGQAASARAWSRSARAS